MLFAAVDWNEIIYVRGYPYEISTAQDSAPKNLLKLTINSLEG